MIIGVAGPYSAPTEEQRKKNLDAMNDAAARLLEKGHVPIIGVNAALPIIERSNVDDKYKATMDISLAVIDKCEALLLLAESPGANKERDLVLSKGLPVYHHIDDVPDVLAMEQFHTTFVATTIENDFVEIPRGEIELRDDRKKTKWTVRIETFLLSKYPVTQDLYFAVTDESPSTFKGNRKPVETVSWKDAVIFCNKLSAELSLQPCYAIDDALWFDQTANGFRLPTEAEWEYACKAGTKDVRYGALDDIACYKKNSGGGTQDVGQKQPSPWGLHDMLGNVWEWCNDVYDEAAYGSYRVFRGGGWNDDERGVLATNRRRSHPSSFKIDDLGFRVARNKS